MGGGGGGIRDGLNQCGFKQREGCATSQLSTNAFPPAVSMPLSLSHTHTHLWPDCMHHRQQFAFLSSARLYTWIYVHKRPSHSFTHTHTHTHTHTPNDQNPCPSLTFHPSPPPFGAHMLTICANLSHWNTFVKGNDSLEGCNFRNGAVPCGVIADCWLAWTRLIWASFWENWENSFLHRDYSVLGKQVTQSVTEQWHEEVTQLHTISL